MKLIRDGWIWRGADTTPAPVPENVLIDGGRIVAVGADVAAEGAEVIEAAGMLVLPGLVNAHFHSPVNHMKGRLPSLPLEIFMLYESPSLESLRPTPREAYVRTLLACMEMLRSGVTAVQDDAFFTPHPTPEIVDAVARAYEDCGIRARLALDQSNLPELAKLPYLEALLPPDQRRALAAPPSFGTAELLAAYDHLIGRWNGAAGGRIGAAISCSAPQRVSPDYATALQRLAERHDLPFYVHILETRTQRVFGAERLGGRSLVALADELGVLTPHANVIHAIWVDDADLDLIAARGAAIAHNPISNLRLGSGVMRFRAVRDRGIPVALGTDEAIADDAGPAGLADHPLRSAAAHPLRPGAQRQLHGDRPAGERAGLRDDDRRSVRRDAGLGRPAPGDERRAAQLHLGPALPASGAVGGAGACRDPARRGLADDARGDPRRSRLGRRRRRLIAAAGGRRRRAPRYTAQSEGRRIGRSAGPLRQPDRGGPR